LCALALSCDQSPICIVILNKQKNGLFHKNREQEDKTGPVLWVGSRGKGEDIRKGCRRVNMVEILYILVCKWRMRPVETISGKGEGKKGE
jgi:hypothetical protein